MFVHGRIFPLKNLLLQKGIFHRGGAGLLATLGVPHATDVEVV